MQAQVEDRPVFRGLKPTLNKIQGNPSIFQLLFIMNI